VSKRKELAPARPRRRPYNQKDQKQRFLLCCEGKGTEPGYFRSLANFLRNPLIELIEVEIAAHEGTDPKQVVEQAKRLRADADREARRMHDDNLRYDQIWCVFDRDEHVHFDEAINQASDNNLGLAVSNPCFELWILIHFQNQTGGLTRKDAQGKVRSYLPNYNKSISFIELKGHTNEAARRARKMEFDAEESGKATDNPTTGVWKLVKKLCEDSNIDITSI
jgi:hypothetical protein